MCLLCAYRNYNNASSCITNSTPFPNVRRGRGASCLHPSGYSPPLPHPSTHNGPFLFSDSNDSLLKAITYRGSELHYPVNSARPMKNSPVGLFLCGNCAKMGYCLSKSLIRTFPRPQRKILAVCFTKKRPLSIGFRESFFE